MKIWIINEYAGSPSYGMTFRHYYLAKEFLKKAHKVTIISASFSHLLKTYPQMNGNVYQCENVDGVDFLWIKVMRYCNSFNKKRALKWLEFTCKLFFIDKKLKEKPDVIICSTTELFAIVPAYILSKKYQAKLVFEVRDIWPLTLVEIGGFSEKNLFIRIMSWLEKFSLQKSDVLVSNLSNYKEHIQNLGINKKAYWISNGIDLDEMENSEPLPTYIEQKIPKGKFIVGYTGKLGVSNALIYLLEAAKFLKENENIVFVIVGDGEEKACLQKFAEDLPNVLFLESIPKTQVQSMLNFFDVCYIGLQKKKLFKFGISPNKIYDYMYSAKPIVHSIETNDSIVEQSHCGLCVEAENAKAIAKAIQTLYELPQESRNQLGENGKTYVMKHFTYDTLAQKYLNCLST